MRAAPLLALALGLLAAAPASAVDGPALVVALGASPALGAAGTSFETVGAVRASETGTGIPGVEVRIFLDGVPYGSRLSSTNGAFWATMSFPAERGPHVVQAAAAPGTPLEARGSYTVHTIVPPGAPTMTGWTAIEHTFDVRVDWERPADTGGGYITSFQIERRVPGGAWELRGTSVVSAQYRIEALPALSSFDYRVRAANHAGWGPWSEPLSLTTPPPPPVASVAAQIGNVRFCVGGTTCIWTGSPGRIDVNWPYVHFDIWTWGGAYTQKNVAVPGIAIDGEISTNAVQLCAGSPCGPVFGHRTATWQATTGGDGLYNAYSDSVYWTLGWGECRRLQMGTTARHAPFEGSGGGHIDVCNRG